MPVLTEIRIRAAKPQERAYKLFDERGLFMLVTPSGGRLWRFRYRLGGVEKLLTLGYRIQGRGGRAAGVIKYSDGTSIEAVARGAETAKRRGLCEMATRGSLRPSSAIAKRINNLEPPVNDLTMLEILRVENLAVGAQCGCDDHGVIERELIASHDVNSTIMDFDSKWIGAADVSDRFQKFSNFG
jgi:hypothetical protein